MSMSIFASAQEVGKIDIAALSDAALAGEWRRLNQLADTFFERDPEGRDVFEQLDAVAAERKRRASHL